MTGLMTDSKKLNLKMKKQNLKKKRKEVKKKKALQNKKVGPMVVSRNQKRKVKILNHLKKRVVGLTEVSKILKTIQASPLNKKRMNGLRKVSKLSLFQVL